MKPSDFDLELEELRRKAIVPLVDEVFDKAAFQALKDYLCKKAELIKSEHVVSKQVLMCLIEASRIIESRAERITAVRENLALAREFEMLIGLVASGEGCSDRKPGVPRVI